MRTLECARDYEDARVRYKEAVIMTTQELGRDYEDMSLIPATNSKAAPSAYSSAVYMV